MERMINRSDCQDKRLSCDIYFASTAQELLLIYNVVLKVFSVCKERTASNDKLA